MAIIFRCFMLGDAGGESLSVCRLTKRVRGLMDEEKLAWGVPRRWMQDASGVVQTATT
jgi:hypothetical protein